jgi:hypothetical protein
MGQIFKDKRGEEMSTRFREEYPTSQKTMFFVFLTVTRFSEK